MILIGDNQKIELKIEGYELPTIQNCYYDNNWLVVWCKKTFEKSVVSGKSVCILTTDLLELKEKLEQFLEGRTKKVWWNGTEPNLQIYIKKSYLMKIYFYGDNEKNNEVKAFRKKATREDIIRLIDFCTESLDRFPIRNIGIN